MVDALLALIVVILTVVNKKEKQMVSIKVKRLESAEGLNLPCQMTAGSSGADLEAAVSSTLILNPGEFAPVPTGLTVEIPMGYEMQVRPRSGLAAKNGITVLNTPGTVDADYRGEVKVILINLGPVPFEITRGMRIAQAVIAEVPRVEYIEVEDLSDTERGSGGFGHTGR